ncbi:DUF1351 domain-containing protein [Firmicutes bacterium AF16-15]|nr:DUF1351 domain-containing protein [Firmicutes bacterium AF16-15]
MNELNELQVVVNQEVGAIHWNFEELKTALAAEMKKYEGIVYDDDSIADAKRDIAYLRKLRTSVEDRRKEVKEKCLEPYKKEMDPQAKELVAIIDKPILELGGQVKAYEEEQKRQKKKEILNYMDEKFAELPEAIASKLKIKIYDSKWENKTTGKKIWQSVVDTAVANTKGDLSVLDGVEEDFLEEAKKVYGVNLVLSEALCKVQELRRQKEMILERERQRREAEEAEKREREAAVKKEALARQEEQPQELKKEPVQSVPEEPRTEIGKAVESIERHAYQQAVAGTNADPVGRQPGLTGGRKIWTIQIRGNEEQHRKILDYTKFVGAEYREV